MAVAVVRVLPARALEPAVARVDGRRGFGSDDVDVVFLAPSCVPAFATAFSAASKAGGNARPRASARRRIPAQARALKKYRCGTSPVSKTSDNEHALPSLGHSEVLSVKNAVGEPIPEFCQPSEQGAKRPSVVR